jgi:hypothetical protein
MQVADDYLANREPATTMLALPPSEYQSDPNKNNHNMSQSSFKTSVTN